MAITNEIIQYIIITLIFVFSIIFERKLRELIEILDKIEVNYPQIKENIDNIKKDMININVKINEIKDKFEEQNTTQDVENKLNVLQ